MKTIKHNKPCAKLTILDITRIPIDEETRLELSDRVFILTQRISLDSTSQSVAATFKGQGKTMYTFFFKNGKFDKLQEFN